jgi:hypothetical protein
LATLSLPGQVDDALFSQKPSEVPLVMGSPKVVGAGGAVMGSLNEIGPPTPAAPSRFAYNTSMEEVRGSSLRGTNFCFFGLWSLVFGL